MNRSFGKTLLKVTSLSCNPTLVASGQIKFRETVEEGLENAPAAFLRLLKGGNFGKQLVRVGADP